MYIRHISGLFLFLNVVCLYVYLVCMNTHCSLSIILRGLFECSLCGAPQLSGRMPDSQSRDPGFESPLLPFRSVGIFVRFTTPQSTQLYK